MKHLRPLFTLPCLLALTICVCPRHARASGQAELSDAITQLNDAKGPEAYTAIRRIWAQWGNANPLHVETALNDAANSVRFSADVRDYARFFSAHARTRRGDVVSAHKIIKELGYVTQWLVVGPFDNEGKIGFNTEYGPEAQFAEPIVQGRAYSGKERAVRWRALPNDAFQSGWLRAANLFQPEQSVCFYGSSFVTVGDNAPVAARRYRFHVGTRGAFKLFVDSTKVLEDAAYRGHDVDRLAADVELSPGTHRITVKGCGLEAAPVVSLRVNGLGRAPKPKFSATFLDASDAARGPAQAKLLEGDLGPLKEFERLTSKEQAGARILEAHARYLVATYSDDPAEHAARDLARRAAEKSPTVKRLLLAGELAEDYNHHRSWLEKAEALAKQKHETRTDLLLARAAVERSGLNWRDAFPYYRQVLELDPDDLVALRGEVELLNRAGLERSALKLLQNAVSRSPDSVLLLNMYASQLAKLGLDADAADAEQRYAQYRLDDQNFLTGRLELALARDDKPTAEHWIERLIEYNPGSLWVQSHVAKAYQRLGQPERAVAAYEYALTLSPENVGTLRELSDLRGQMGEVSEQLRLLHKILDIQPQAADVQSYVEFLEPHNPRQDEAYAWEPDKFLKNRDKADSGDNRRTLLDLTVQTVFDNGLGSEFKQVVFQPLTDAAAALSRNYYFQYEAGRQRVQLRGARVFRTDGRIDEAIETGEGAANDPSIAMYTSARTYNVQFPRLEPGDVVELRYRIDDVASRNEFSDYFGATEYLQSEENIGHVEYVLLAPKARKLYIDHRGIPGLKTSKKDTKEQQVLRFWADNVPAIVPEPAMPPWAEVAGFVHVSTYPSYKELGEWYWGLAQDQFDLDDETRKLVHKLADQLPTERAKVSAVYDWVIRNTRYVALEFGIYGFKPRRCVQTVARGWGDCKDKATVIVSMLKELGIDSTIVIVRTQMRGRFKSNVASLAPFDHAIAYVPSLKLYLDGTAEYTGSEELPAMDQQAMGILINRGKPKLVTLPLLPPDKNYRVRDFDIRFKKNGSADLKAELTAKGNRAPSWRRRYNAASSRRERVEQDLSPEFPGLLLKKGKQGLDVDLDDFEEPARVRVNGSVATFGRKQGDAYSLPVTLSVRLTDKYASLSTRHLDVSIPSFGQVRERVKLKLPPGMKVEAAPVSVKHGSRFGSFSVDVKQDKNQVTVETQLTLKVTRVSPKDYRAWRSFCKAFDLAMTPRLVVR